jgi:membrane protein
MSSSDLFHDPISKLQVLRRFYQFLWKRFWDDQCFEAAAALAYTTLLALVPLGAVSLSIMAAFPKFQAAKQALLEFLFTQFVPSTGTSLQSYVEPLFARASALTVPGVIALMVSAVLMMNSIEAAFNRIWRAPTERPPLQRFVVFWAALTLGPMLLGASLVLSGYVRSLPFFHGADAERRFLSALPAITAFIGFTLSYLIVPHRRVRWRHALAGGLLATLLFECAKRGFAWYVAAFPATKQIYDALSLLPIFLLWLYIVWLIALLGASFASTLGAFRFEKDAPVVPPQAWLLFALRVLGQLRGAQLRGEGMENQDLKARIPGLTDDLLQRFLSDFDRLKMVTRTELGHWVLIRDLSSVTLLDLYRTGHYPLPTDAPERVIGEPWERTLIQKLSGLSDDTHRVLLQPIAAFFAAAPAAIKTPAARSAAIE